MSLALASLLLAASPAALPACTWDRPGHNPFMGDVVAAVDRYTDIPPPVRARLKARMAERRYDEVVSIRRDEIAGRARYDGAIRDMHFGTGQVCASVTRARWTAQMQERGLVYCEDGHCILVPTVCRNVSRITRLAPAAAAQGPGPAGAVAGAAGARAAGPTGSAGGSGGGTGGDSGGGAAGDQGAPETAGRSADPTHPEPATVGSFAAGATPGQPTLATGTGASSTAGADATAASGTSWADLAGGHGQAGAAALPGTASAPGAGAGAAASQAATLGTRLLAAQSPASPITGGAAAGPLALPSGGPGGDGSLTSPSAVSPVPEPGAAALLLAGLGLLALARRRQPH